MGSIAPGQAHYEGGPEDCHGCHSGDGQGAAEIEVSVPQSLSDMASPMVTLESIPAMLVP